MNHPRIGCGDARIRRPAIECSPDLGVVSSGLVGSVGRPSARETVLRAAREERSSPAPFLSGSRGDPCAPRVMSGLRSHD